MENKCKKIETLGAPKAVGPYSQAVVSCGFLFVSGQLPIDPKTGKLVEGNIREMANRVLDNIDAILKEGGIDFSSVVKVEIFLKDLKDFSAVNEEYAKRFLGAVFPARQTIQVAGLPMNAALEISCIAKINNP